MWFNRKFFIFQTLPRHSVLLPFSFSIFLFPLLISTETNRFHQILAVLETNMNLPLSRYDCYLAVAGGLEVEEPAADLGVAAAVVSSYRNLILPEGTILLGELGLGGQLRPVGQIPKRLQEAERLGFQRAVLPKGSGVNQLEMKIKLKLIEASNINEALILALGVNPGSGKQDSKTEQNC